MIDGYAAQVAAQVEQVRRHGSSADVEAWLVSQLSACRRELGQSETLERLAHADLDRVRESIGDVLARWPFVWLRYRTVVGWLNVINLSRSRLKL